MLRVILVLVLLAMTIYALIDCTKTDSTRMPARISKPVWIVAIAILPIIGPLLWLGIKTQKMLKSDPNIAGQDFTNKFRSRNNPKSNQALAPDDDPDFLSRLEAQNRRRQYEQKKAEDNPNQKFKRRHSDDGEDDDPQHGLYR